MDVWVEGGGCGGGKEGAKRSITGCWKPGGETGMSKCVDCVCVCVRAVRSASYN